MSSPAQEGDGPFNLRQGARTREAVQNRRTAKPDASSAETDRAKPEWPSTVRQALVHRLYSLEVANKQLSDEKTQLENQLLHVLRRLASREQGDPATSAREPSQASMEKGDSSPLLDLIARLKSSRIDHGERARHPPLVQFGDPNRRRSSLGDSSSFKLVSEYTSLSDTYEDICLNTDPMKNLCSSELETPPDPEGPSLDDEPPKRLDAAGGDLVKVSRAVKRGDQVKRYDSRPDRQNPMAAKRSLSISDVSYLGLLNTCTARQMPSEQNFLWQSLSGNTLTDYSSRSPSETSSSSSSSCKSSEIFSRPNRRQTSSTDTSPPTWLTTAQTAVRQREHSGIRAARKRKRTLPSSRKTVSRIIGDTTISQSRTQPTSGGTEPIAQSSSGPPRVRITRRRIKSPVSLEDSSDATTSLSCLVESLQSKNLTTHARYPDSKTSLGYVGKALLRSTKTQKEGISERGQVEPRALVHERYTPSMGKRSEMAVGHYRDFLNSQIQFYRLPPSTLEGLYESDDLTLIQLLSDMILGMDVYTCIKKRATLLLSVQPSKECYMPLLPRNNSTSTHSQQSSELNSEWSPPTSDEQDVTRLSPENALTITWMLSSGCQEKKTSHKSEEPTQPLTAHSATAKRQKVKPIDEQIDGSFVLHKNTLYRLRNHVKIWRKYFGFMSLSSLLLYTEEWPGRREASCCIQLCDIQAIRRSSNLSTSVTTGLTGSRLIQPDPARPAEGKKYVASSVPITRKFQPVFHSQAPGRNTFDNFEVVLLSGKTYRFRGETQADTNRWMLLVRRAFRAVRAREILQRRGAQLTTQGYLKRIKGGVASRVWCRLVGEYLIYSETPDSAVPSGYRSLKDTWIRYMKHSPIMDRKRSTDCLYNKELWADDCFVSNSDSDSLTIGDMDSQQHRTIALWMGDSDPVYLICDTEDECQRWYCHLVTAGKTEKHDLAAPVDSSQAQELLQSHWRRLVRPEYTNNLFHSNLPARSPISLSTDVNSSAELSVKMFACLLFLSYPEMEYHPATEAMTAGVQLPMVTLLGSAQWQTMKYGVIKWLANCCLRNPVLKDELFLQLIKQAWLTENQLVRWAKTEMTPRIERMDSPRRKFSIFCGKPGSSRSTPKARSTTYKGQALGMSDVNPLRISSRQTALLGDVVDQLGPNTNIILPAPAMGSQDRLHRGWPILAIWECLCLFLPLFLPSNPVLNCLKVLLHAQLLLETGKKSGDKMPAWLTELSLYAAFCREAIASTEMRGGRMQKPSALEVTAISMRNPYTYTFPFSLPIHWVDGNAYEVVSFNGSSDFRYVVEHFTRKLGFHNNGQQHQKPIQGAIYMRVSRAGSPAKQYYYLKPDWKICDVISLYEESILKKEGNIGRAVHLEEASVEFVFRVQAFSWRLLKRLDDVHKRKKILHLLCHQLHSDIVSGTYQIDLTGNDLLNLVGLLCRVDHFDYNELQRQHQFTMDQILPAYFPKEWLEALRADNQEIIKLKLLLLDRWMLISKTCASRERPTRFDDTVAVVRPNEASSRSTLDEIQFLEVMNACMTYLCYLRRLSPNRFGASTFICRVEGLFGCSADQLVHLVPQNDQLSFIVIKPTEGPLRVPPSSSSRQPTHTSSSIHVSNLLGIPYKEILSFGGQSNGGLFLVHTIPSSAGNFRHFSVGTREHHVSSIRGRSELERRIYRSPTYMGQKKANRRPDLVLRKLHIYLKDLNALLELTDILLYFINADHP